MTADTVLRAVAAADAAFADTRARLEALIRIPSCSFPGFDPAHVVASAEASAAWLRACGFPSVTVERLDGAPHPWVIAEDRRAGPDAPTVLLYAHHDVQPPLRTELWRSPPFEPTERDGRLYARGAADDKAGIAVHCAAVAAWRAAQGALPVNVVALIEGEEEIGSPNMVRFLQAHRRRLACDCVVIADLVNVDTGMPSLTTSLRGLVAVEVELAALRAPLHSGMWGGAVPDPATALCRLLATLHDAQGRIAVPGLLDAVRPPSAAERAGFARIPYDAARFAEQAGLVAAAPEPDGVALWSRLWREPSLVVNAIQAGTRGQTGNVVMDQAWARVGIRIVPDMRPDEVLRRLTAHLEARAPAGMRLTVKPSSAGAPWATATDHPAFAVAREALRIGYGQDPVEIGCGASIPFVAEMTAALGGVPALLVGVEDPVCGAHAENESVHLDDLRKAVRAETAFLGLLASMPPR